MESQLCSKLCVTCRMDEAIEFPLPGMTERRQILKMYLDSYIAKAGTSEGAKCLQPLIKDFQP